MNRLLPVMAAATTADLAQRVETLARIRNGDHAGAIAMLEQNVDAATVSLPIGKPGPNWTPARSAQQLAKAYRSTYAPAPTESALVQLLATIPMPAVEYCSPALRKVLADGARQ